MPGLIQIKQEVTPKWPTNNTGTKSCPHQAERDIADDWIEGKSSLVTIAGSTQHTQETLQKCQILANRGYHLQGIQNLFSSSHYIEKQK